MGDVGICSGASVRDSSYVELLREAWPADGGGAPVLNCRFGRGGGAIMVVSCCKLLGAVGMRGRGSGTIGPGPNVLLPGVPV